MPNFNTGGDQLFLLTANPLSGVWQFLYGLEMNGGWNTTAADAFSSADPGETAIRAQGS